VGLVSSDNNSRHNALQFNIEKRFGYGLSLLANYTYAKTTDDYGWTNPFNRHFDSGLSDDDIRHNFKFSNVWELPKAKVNRFAGAILNGWTLNSITTWRSGFPFSIYSGQDNSFSAVGRDRADSVGGSATLDSGRSHGELIQRYFDTSKFVPNAIGTFGNTGKNILRAPGFYKTDFGALKNFHVTESASLQFRTEFFNVFNNVNFGAPGNNVGSSDSFGVITSAGSPRIIQFALKVLF